MNSTIQKAFASFSVGGLIGVVVQYVLTHFDPSAFGILGPFISTVVGAAATALTHHFQTSNSSTSGS